jgi:hypothetical protein
MLAGEVKRRLERDIGANVGVNDSRRGTRGQLVGGTVEVQLACPSVSGGFYDSMRGEGADHTRPLLLPLSRPDYRTMLHQNKISAPQAR